MSQADELLESITSESNSTDGLADGNIIIGEDRFMTVPSYLQRLGVQYDHNVETVTFDCPRYWDGRDLYGMRIYVNYMRAHVLPGKSGRFIAHRAHFDFVMMAFALHFALADFAVSFPLLNVVQFAAGAFDQTHNSFLLPAMPIIPLAAGWQIR